MVVLEVVLWLLVGLLLAFIHMPLFARSSTAVWWAGLLGAASGGLAVQALHLPPLAVGRLSVTALIAATLVAEVFLLLTYWISRLRRTLSHS